MSSAPDLLYIDALLLAYRLGQMRSGELRAAMLAAARSAKDSLGFMTALENFGVGRHSQLHTFVGNFLAAPSYYRAQYPAVIGLRREDEEPEPFLSSRRVLFLVEAVLTKEQQQLFFDAYWWFVHNHQETYHDTKKGWMIGAYASQPQDNASTLARFEDYLLRLVNHRNLRMRQRFANFPVDILLTIFRRAFL